MTGWTSEELDRIGTAQELEVASLRADGVDKPMTSGETRATTLRLEPRAAKGAA